MTDYRTFATSLVCGGTDLVIVAEFLGHARLETETLCPISDRTSSMSETLVALRAVRRLLIVRDRHDVPVRRLAFSLGGRRRLIPFATVAVAGLTPPAAALSASSPSATSPALRVHAIFSGGRESRFHAGEVLQVGVRHSGGRRLTEVCWSPAPIARPACSRSGTAAPAQAGATTVTATLNDGTKLTRSFRVLHAATKVGGPVAVPATIRCEDVTVFGGYDRRRHRSYAPQATIKRGAKVGLYNRIAPNVIFMWIYATNEGGFGSERCAQPDSP